MKLITSADNKYIKLAASLKQRKYREENQMFLVEGRRAVAEALTKPELVAAIFVKEKLALEYSIPDIFPSVELLQVGTRLMRQVCNTEKPQGVAAILKKPVWSWEGLLTQRGMLVLLDRIADPGNMGSILRSCWAFGVEGVLLSQDCVDPFGPKVVRSSMGAILNVPVFPEVSDLQLNALQALGVSFLATDVSRGHHYYSIKYPRPSLLVIGSEAQGVSEAIKKRCQGFINIPINPQVDSLNVAAACAIIIAEVGRQYREGTEWA
jgi:TrmH family RNA methyltransferase